MTTPASPWLFRQWLLALILAVGVASVWTIVSTWLLTSVVVQNTGNYETLAYSADGEPYIQTYSMSNYQTRSYRSLDGEKVNADEQSWLIAASAGGDPQDSWQTPSSGWGGRIAALSDGRAPATYWYYLHDGQDPGSAYFVGYDSLSRRRVGFLDATGFHADTPRQTFQTVKSPANQWMPAIASSQGVYSYRSVHEPAHYNIAGSGRFPGWRVYVIHGDRLLEVDLRERDKPPRVLLEQEGMLSVQIHAGHYSGVVSTQAALRVAADARYEREALIVSTRDKVIVYDPVEEETIAFARPVAVVGKGVNVYRPRGGGLIMEHSSFRPEAGNVPTTIYTFAADGSLAHTSEVDLTRGNPTSPQMAAAGFTLAAPVPLLGILASAVLLPATKMQLDHSIDYGTALLQSLAEMGSYPLLTILLSAALAWMCYRRQRRYADPVVVPWIILIMLLGLPGYLGYRLYRQWPRRISCPACHMPSPTDRQECIDCGADWPKPDAKGIEVYA